MNAQNNTAAIPPSPADYAALVGLDWGDEKHALSLCAAGSTVIERATLEQTPEALADWANTLRARFPDRKIAVALEQARGALLAGLSQYEHIVPFPVNPKSLARWLVFVKPFTPVAPKMIGWTRTCCWSCSPNSATICGPGSPIRSQPASWLC